MNEKIMVIVIFSVLGIGFLGVLMVAVPWVLGHGGDWKQWLRDDAIILFAIIMFLFGFYNNTKIK